MWYNDVTKKTGSLEQLLPNIENSKSLSVDELRALEVYEVVNLPYNPSLQKVDGVEYNVKLDQVQTKLVDLVLDDIKVLKANKVSELKRIAYGLFRENEWYYLRELRTSILNGQGKGARKNIPQAVLDKDYALSLLVDRIEQEILALKTQEEVILYQINMNF